MTANQDEAPRNWHPADIKAALAKAGYSFARIAREYGYAENSPNTVLWRPWSVMELIVAGIVGVKPQNIWPSRYDRQGRHLGTRKDSTLKDL
ncbi:MAG: helix-turn-helix domain-containing protein [Syntrophotaleaceae bacterium]